MTSVSVVRFVCWCLTIHSLRCRGPQAQTVTAIDRLQ